MRVIGDLSRVNARRYPDKIALLHGERALTYRQLDQRSNRLAHALLASGVQPGDRVALLAFNCLDFAVITQGVAKAGAILVPLNFRLSANEIADMLRDASPAVIIIEAGFGPALAQACVELESPPRVVLLDGAADLAGGVVLDEWVASHPESQPGVEVDPAGPCVIMYTSGTTGAPKGVLVSHEAYFRMYMATAIETRLTREDLFLMAVPMFHAAGMNMMLHQALFLGAAGVIHRGSFDPEAIFRLIEQHRLTMAVLVPTVIGIMAQHPRRRDYDLSSLRTVFYGSMPMPRAVLDAALDAFPNVRFNQLYGSTESGMLGALTWEEHAEHAHMTGREALLSEMRIVDERGQDVGIGEIGEVIGRQQCGMLGYWRNPRATAETVRGGWIHTGDLARREEDGFFTVVGRLKEMIISGGENIYPVEVERVLAEHPAIREVAVLGVGDPLYGESVCAAVVFHPGERASVEELDELCRSRLAGYKRPRRYEVLDALPRNASDKVQKHRLRAQFESRTAAER